MSQLPRANPVSALRPRWTLLLLALTVASGCYREPTRWDEVQQKTRAQRARGLEGSGAGVGVQQDVPQARGDFDVVYTQEKTGFAQAKLVKKGRDVATLSIFDTVSNPEAADKYKDTRRRSKATRSSRSATTGQACSSASATRSRSGPRTRTSRSSTAKTG